MTPDQICFFIAPIGAVDSDERKRSDRVRDYIVGPAATKHGRVTVRADAISEPGQITHQVIEHLISDAAVVADLTGRNANVYYELAVRHAFRLPAVLIADEGDRDHLPFDLSQMRTVFFDHTDLESADQAKTSIEELLGSALAGAVSSPITSAVDLRALQTGSTVERAVADMSVRLEQLSETVSRFRPSLEVRYPTTVASPTTDALRAALLNPGHTTISSDALKAALANLPNTPAISTDALKAALTNLPSTTTISSDALKAALAKLAVDRASLTGEQARALPADIASDDSSGAPPARQPETGGDDEKKPRD